MADNGRINITLHLYKIEKPAWHQITDRQKNAVAEIIQKGGWTRTDERRYGFLNCSWVDNVVYGYYAHEGGLRIEQYDDKQLPTIDGQESFERIIFLLYLDAGIVLVQSKRIFRYVDLSGPKIRQSLFHALGEIFHQVGLVFQGRAIFNRYQLQYSRDDLIKIFEGNKIQRIKIDNLTYQHVPEDLRLFNPNFDADAFLKAVIDEDLKKSSQVEWSGEDLQKTKIARGLFYSGEPQFVSGLNQNGEYQEWTQSNPEEVVIDMNVIEVQLPENDLHRLLERVRNQFNGFSERLLSLRSQAKLDDLPLFDISKD